MGRSKKKLPDSLRKFWTQLEGLKSGKGSRRKCSLERRGAASLGKRPVCRPNHRQRMARRPGAPRKQPAPTASAARLSLPWRPRAAPPVYPPPASAAIGGDRGGSWGVTTGWRWGKVVERDRIGAKGHHSLRTAIELRIWGLEVRVFPGAPAFLNGGNGVRDGPVRVTGAGAPLSPGIPA